MATAPGATAERINKQQFLDVFDMEHKTTLRVLRAYPADKLELKPHKLCKTARELAWMFVMEQRMAQKLLTTGLDMSKPMPHMEPPASMDEIVTQLDSEHRAVADLVARMSEDDLRATTKFFVAPKTTGDVQKMQIAWMFLHDQIHHRGQFSIYLRMADAKVPSIYGPTADEPWD